jgi:predicted HTH domain antitoxin
MRTVTLDDELAALLEKRKPLDQAAREALVIELFRRREISTGKACSLLSVSRVDFARRISDLGIPYFLMSKDDWAAEQKTIDAWLAS